MISGNPDPVRYRTVMAFDYGLSQIGVAVGNCLLGTSEPMGIVRARQGVPDWVQLQQLVDEWLPDLLVVGDPLNMDGSASELCTRARRFSRQLHGRLQLPVALCDERLSSFEAKQQRKALGHRGDFKKDPVDSYAAQLILQTWMAENAPAGS